jgi:tetratricopeptide (TPR) repeat protein
MVNLGVAYFNQQSYQKAIEEYLEVIKHQPQNFQAYYGLGYSYLMMGSYNEAKQYLHEALRIKPDYLEAQILLDKVTSMAVLGIKPMIGVPQ